jgi:chromosome partitioning protein
MRKDYKRFLRNAIPFSTDVEKMGINRSPIDLYAPTRQANRAYQALWQEIATLLRDR